LRFHKAPETQQCSDGSLDNREKTLIRLISKDIFNPNAMSPTAPLLRTPGHPEETRQAELSPQSVKTALHPRYTMGMPTLKVQSVYRDGAIAAENFGLFCAFKGGIHNNPAVSRVS
jgi:hypothetical protein